MDHTYPAFMPAHTARRGSTRPTLLSAFHEAGHALQQLYFGGQIVEVMIRSRAEAATYGSDYVDCEGLINAGVGTGVCIAPAIFNPEFDELDDCWSRIRAEMQMMVLVGGIYPLQRRFRLTSAAAALGFGGKDYTQARRIADLLEDRRLAFRTAEDGARALVRSDAGWRFICALAGRLLDEGVLLGNECREIFEPVFGRAPVSTPDWYSHWPPTLEQLRAGWLPCH